MCNDGFGPPRELLEVYAVERETGRTTENLELWLRQRAYVHYGAASPAEHPHCWAAIGMSTRQDEPGSGFWSR